MFVTSIPCVVPNVFGVQIRSVTMIMAASAVVRFFVARISACAEDSETGS